MRKIKTKITSAIILCSVFSIFLLGSFVYIIGSVQLSKSAQQNLQSQAEIQEKELNLMFAKVEYSVRGLATVVTSSMDDDISKLNDPNYLRIYEESIRKISSEFANNTEGAMAFYVRFNPKLSPGTSGIFHADTKGNGKIEQLTPTDFSQYDENDLAHVGWYYIPVKAGKAMWLDPYLNANLNVYMISYVIPIYKNGQSVGIVGMDIDFRKIEDKLKSFTCYKTGYASLVNANYQVLYHPTLNKNDNIAQIENGALKTVTDKIGGTDKNGYIEYDYQGSKKIFAYQKLQSGQTLILTAAKSEVLSELNTLGLIILGVVILGIIISILIGCFTGLKITKPINAITSFLKDIANNEGDLVSRININSNDEIGQMAAYFNSFIEKLHDIIYKLKQSTVELNDYSKELICVAGAISSVSSITSQKSGNIYSEIENINGIIQRSLSDTRKSSINMERIFKNVDSMDQAICSLAASTEEGSASSENIQSTIKHMIENIEVFSTSTNNLSTMVSSVSGSIKELHTSINTISTNCGKSVDISADASSKSSEANKMIHELNNSITQITKILEMINNISSQTKMLALNASIEAVSSGEAGKGFMIVSSEIKALAKQTESATHDISLLIDTMKDKMVSVISVVEGISKVVNEIDTISNSIDSAMKVQLKISDEIAKSISLASNNLIEFRDLFNSFKNDSQNVERNVIEASSISSHLADSATELSISSKEVAVLAQDTNSSIQEVSQTTENISLNSKNIEGSIKEIKNITLEILDNSSKTTSLAEKLSSISNVLQNFVKMFKVKE